uniref:Perlucin n=1 Tax=Magallana gigas TaxID=29159 RepID=K1RB88_MAGGI
MSNGVSFLLFILVWATGVIANCPSGYTQHGNSCYVINRVQASWAQATNFDPPRFWVGGSDLLQEGKWTWTKTGSVIGSQGFSHWGPGQPDNGVEHLDEHCLELEAGHHWLWNDDDCEEFKHFICEKE